MDYKRYTNYTSYKNITLKELKEISKINNLKGYSQLNKEELIRFLKKNNRLLKGGGHVPPPGNPVNGNPEKKNATVIGNPVNGNPEKKNATVIGNPVNENPATSILNSVPNLSNLTSKLSTVVTGSNDAENKTSKNIKISNNTSQLLLLHLNSNGVLKGAKDMLLSEKVELNNIKKSNSNSKNNIQKKYEKFKKILENSKYYDAGLVKDFFNIYMENGDILIIALDGNIIYSSEKVSGNLNKYFKETFPNVFSYKYENKRNNNYKGTNSNKKLIYKEPIVRVEGKVEPKPWWRFGF